MTRMSALAFVIGATVAVSVGAAASRLWSAGGDALAADWATKGFLAMALPGVAGGLWMVREHGRAGSRFVVALLAGIFVRMVFAAIVALGAAKAGGSATTGLVAGLAAGFVAVTLFVTGWFAWPLESRGLRTDPRG